MEPDFHDRKFLSSYADAEMGQYFLVDPEKLGMLISAAEIRPTDRVVELGAGAGTIAKEIPQAASLTVVELDARLANILRTKLPNATIIEDDALRLIRELPCDVLIGSLPGHITESLLDILPELTFRTAVLAVGEATDVDRLHSCFTWSEITTITGNDFSPPQPEISRLVKVVPRMSSLKDAS